jgi:hypothetical protein
VALLVFLMFVGSTIPDYVAHAQENRRGCKALFKASHYPASVADRECKRIYDKAIADGKASNAE